MLWVLLLHIIALLLWSGALLYLPALVAATHAGRVDLVDHPDDYASMARFVHTHVATPAGLLAIISGTAFGTLMRAGMFHATAFVCALALFGPLDGWAKTSTAADMVQHMLLMMVVAPLWVLFTLMHTGILGAILTFADAPMYGEARDLGDQQLAGLIMWVVGGVPYLLASGWIAHRW